MKKNERQNIVKHVAVYLMDNIRRGIWEPGGKISSENELAKELKVSRSSVRSAVQQLIAIGVLKSFQGKGTFIKSIPVKDIEANMGKIYENSKFKELIEYRMVVEVEACRLAAERITEESTRKMEENLQGMEDSADDREAFVACDMEFHRLLLVSTGNKLIIQGMDFVRHEIEKQKRTLNTKENVRAAIGYHGKILEALKKHDAAAAARAMRSHMLYNLRSEYLFEGGEG